MSPPALYDGPVAFVNGVHYPVEDGEPNLDRPLRWTADGYRNAEPGEPLHNDVHHESALQLDPGGES